MVVLFTKNIIGIWRSGYKKGGIKIESVIKLVNVGKDYDINRERRKSLKELIINSINKKKYRNEKKIVTILNDINLEINKGDLVGIIGKNGAGKSTLLKILSGIISPTRGSIEVSGKLASILEVGVGFHPDLTGRENALLYGTLLGLRRKELRSILPQIEQFAGISPEYLDMPVGKYSSGMKVRLAFSVATSIDPDILLLDEIFAVGDQDFQQKSKGRILEFVNKGKTVILVSHDLALVEKVCSKIFLLEESNLIIKKVNGGSENV